VGAVPALAVTVTEMCSAVSFPKWMEMGVYPSVAVVGCSGGELGRRVHPVPFWLARKL
jgi:hypothetical protein